jgi:hypothetical protein
MNRGRVPGTPICKAIAVLAGVLLALAGGTAAAAAHVASYDLTIDVDPDARSVRIDARVDVAGHGDLVLHLAPFARDIASGGAFAAELATEPVTGQRAWRLQASDAAPGDELALTYVLDVTPDVEGIALHLGDREGYLLSESAWYPVQLEPLLPRPTPYHLRVRLPDGLIAAGGGAVDVGDDATTIRHAGPGRPFFAYRSYERASEGPLELWLPTEMATEAHGLLPRLAPVVDDIVARYETAFGEACEAVRLVAVTRRGGWGAPCALLLSDDTFAQLADTGEVGAGSYGFLAHELAHTWWGNRVVPAPAAYGLLVEGIAEYLSALAVEARYGAAEADRMWRGWRMDALGDDALAELTVLDDAYYTVAYAKGAWVHRMLADWIGEDAYLEILGELAREASRPDLASYRARLERASGLDLAPFFQEWVHGSAYPRYELDGAAGAWTLRNSGDAATPPLPLELDGERRRVTVAPGETLHLAAETVRVDPGNRVLALAARVDPATRALADAIMDRLTGALTSGDPDRVRAVFTQRDEAVETIAGLAGQLVVDHWSLQSADDGPPRTLTYQLEATLGGRPLAGPLVVELEPGNEPRTVASVRLNYR